MTITVCPNRKGKPRIPDHVCLFHIEQKDPVCLKRLQGGDYVCHLVRKEKEAHEKVD